MSPLRNLDGSRRQINYGWRCATGFGITALLVLLAFEATAQTYTYFNVSPPGVVLMGITTGPDGNVWFTEYGGNQIGRITPDGFVAKFGAGIAPGAQPLFITAGPDGNLWFTEYVGNRIGRITTSGVITEFSIGMSPEARPSGIAAGPDGNVWFTEHDGNRIGRITPNGEITEFTVGAPNAAWPAGITAGPDGNLWFTVFDRSRIGRITPTGVISQFSIGINLAPNFITVGPDGNLWFTELYANRVGRITPLGAITEFSAGITPYSSPSGITTGPDGNLWFVEQGAVAHLGQITPDGRISEIAGPSGTAITTGLDGNLWITQQNGTIIRVALGASNYQGLWWNAPSESESGWGINFAHQGQVIFATWYTYDLTGKAWWLTMTANQAADNVFSGTLYETTGPAFNAQPFNPNLVTRTAVGIGTLTFTDANNGSFAYTVKGVTQTKAITRQVWGVLPTCVWGTQLPLTVSSNYQDLWWVANGAESGWGVNFTHQGGIIFATWFTYDFDGTPLWLSATLFKGDSGVYTGQLIRTTGPAFNAAPFDPNLVTRVPMGALTLKFVNGNVASYAYTVTLPGHAAVSQAKQITRQLFRPGGTVCH